MITPEAAVKAPLFSAYFLVYVPESEVRLPLASTLTNPAVPLESAPTLVRLEFVMVELSVVPAEPASATT